MADNDNAHVGALPQGWKNEGKIDYRWLSQLAEPVLEPSIPIIDPHHHLWDQPGHRYLVDELVADLREGHEIRGTVYVEASSFYDGAVPPELRSLGETREVVRLAEAGGSVGLSICNGIVGFVALRLGDRVAKLLEQHVAASKGHFKGVRNVSIWDEAQSLRSVRSNPPRGLLQDQAFRKGVAQLAKFGLSFDAYVYQTQLGELADLARGFPATTIVLNHLGGPLGAGPYAGRRDELFGPWKDGLRNLADLPNVVVKLGGLGMPSVGFGFRDRDIPASSEVLAAAWKPYVETAIETFGAERCMFESNFPVENEIASYRTLWNAFKRIAGGCSEQEKKWLFHECARETYRLDGAVSVVRSCS
jgi:predicted TIM-barrel fold metal-dependent hydrolase